MGLKGLFGVCLFSLFIACGASVKEDGAIGACVGRCNGLGFQECLEPGVFADPVACPEGQSCFGDLGCTVCRPDSNYCVGDDVFMCDSNGGGGTFVEACEGDDLCSFGSCKSACDQADDNPSNVGCNFWAVDLDNEAVTTEFGTNDAAAQQYAVAVANNNDEPARVRIFQNNARVGEPVDEELVMERTIAAGDLEQFNLPQREVDGTMGQNGVYQKGTGSGTFVSPHGYRVVSSLPVIAYQFNPVIQQFSNDASILIPEQALGRDYYVMGWPTSNPCGPEPGGPFSQESIPDYTSVTIIGTEDSTDVSVLATHPIRASGGDSGLVISQTPAGEELQLTINKYDVINLESDQPVVQSILECLSLFDLDGDFTGTKVTSSKKVVVFSSNERATGNWPDLPRPDETDDKCCTDHLEQQMFPTTALGSEFAISRSPIRSQGGYVEPDLYRVLATKDNTTVRTSLASPFDVIRLNEGEFFTFYSDKGFSAQAEGGAIMLGQILVSQDLTQNGIGDPTFIIFPAAEQHRKSYVFLVPTTFDNNYMVLTMPEDASVELDGQNIGGLMTCETARIGVVAGKSYVQKTCLVSEGVHRVNSEDPMGLTVYGYYSAGSYGYPGGSDVKIINPIE